MLYAHLSNDNATLRCVSIDRRDKTMNMFSIMIRNRIKNKDDDGEKEEEKKEVKKQKNKSLVNVGFIL